MYEGKTYLPPDIHHLWVMLNKKKLGRKLDFRHEFTIPGELEHTLSRKINRGRHSLFASCFPNACSISTVDSGVTGNVDNMESSCTNSAPSRSHSTTRITTVSMCCNGAIVESAANIIGWINCARVMQSTRGLGMRGPLRCLI